MTQAASFAVVIPARDAEATIVEALRSVGAQTLPASEVIVVDDGSSDGTPALARSAAGPIQVLRGAGKGVSSARNLGVAATSTDWIAFLDADDTWRRDHLRTAAAMAAASPDAGALFLSAAVVDEAGAPAGGHLLPEGVCCFEALAIGSVVPTTSATVVRRAAFDSAGGFFNEFGSPAGVEDIDLWLRLSHAGACVSTAAVTVDYLLHTQRDRNRSQAVLAVLERDRELVVERLRCYAGETKVLRRAGAIVRARTARYYLLAGHAADGRRCAVSSLWVRPTLEGAVTLAGALTPAPLRERIRLARRRYRSPAVP